MPFNLVYLLHNLALIGNKLVKFHLGSDCLYFVRINFLKLAVLKKRDRH